MQRSITTFILCIVSLSAHVLAFLYFILLSIIRFSVSKFLIQTITTFYQSTEYSISEKLQSGHDTESLHHQLGKKQRGIINYSIY